MRRYCEWDVSGPGTENIVVYNLMSKYSYIMKLFDTLTLKSSHYRLKVWLQYEDHTFVICQSLQNTWYEKQDPQETIKHRPNLLQQVITKSFTSQHISLRHLVIPVLQYKFSNLNKCLRYSNLTKLANVKYQVETRRRSLFRRASTVIRSHNT